MPMQKTHWFKHAKLGKTSATSSYKLKHHTHLNKNNNKTKINKQ